MWVMLAFVILCFLGVSGWLCLLFIVLTIVIHAIFAYRAKQKAQNSSIITTTTPATIPGTSSAISKEYFDQVSKAVEDLMFEYKYACRSPHFQEEINKGNINLTLDGAPITDLEQKVQMLFWIDLTRCYVGLGHNIDLNSKTGFGLLYFFLRTLGLNPISYKQSADLQTNTFYPHAENVIKGIRDAMPDYSERFIVAQVLGQYDEKRKQKYLVDIYRFASITAKADNIVTEEEAEWLSEILKLQSKGNVKETIVEEEEPQTVSDTPVTPAKPKRIAAKTELKNLIGLESVKEEVEALTNYIRIQKTRGEKGLKTSPISYHCVFTGNPGTGKTTVARILAKIYKSLGVVSKGQLIETDRSGLVAEYVGQTAVKTNKIIDSALDGVLFIDEAYSLIAGGESDYGKEAIATLLKRMEDDRDRLVVILAGYTKEMKDFIDSNPGLQSRFNRYIEFPDYNADDLYQIFCKQVKQFDYTMTEDAEQALKEYLAYQVTHKDQNFGNARFVRNVFERTLQNQANRLAKEVNLTTEKLSQIEKIDLPLQ